MNGAMLEQCKYHVMLCHASARLHEHQKISGLIELQEKKNERTATLMAARKEASKLLLRKCIPFYEVSFAADMNF